MVHVLQSFCVRLGCGVLRDLHFIHVANNAFQLHKPKSWRLTQFLTLDLYILSDCEINPQIFFVPCFSKAFRSISIALAKKLEIDSILNLGFVYPFWLWKNIKSISKDNTYGIWEGSPQKLSTNIFCAIFFQSFQK